MELEERYKLFKGTILECGTHLLSLSDEEIRHYLFEEFSIDAVSFLYEDLLNDLFDEGMIDMAILKQSQELRRKFLELEKNNSIFFNVESVRAKEEWKTVLALGDSIAKLLYL